MQQYATIWYKNISQQYGTIIRYNNTVQQYRILQTMLDWERSFAQGMFSSHYFVFDCLRLNLNPFYAFELFRDDFVQERVNSILQQCKNPNEIDIIKVFEKVVGDCQKMLGCMKESNIVELLKPAWPLFLKLYPAQSFQSNLIALKNHLNLQSNHLSLMEAHTSALSLQANKPIAFRVFQIEENQLCYRKLAEKQLLDIVKIFYCKIIAAKNEYKLKDVYQECYKQLEDQVIVQKDEDKNSINKKNKKSKGFEVKEKKYSIKALRKIKPRCLVKIIDDILKPEENSYVNIQCKLFKFALLWPYIQKIQEISSISLQRIFYYSYFSFQAMKFIINLFQIAGIFKSKHSKSKNFYLSQLLKDHLLASFLLSREQQQVEIQECIRLIYDGDIRKDLQRSLSLNYHKSSQSNSKKKETFKKPVCCIRMNCWDELIRAQISGVNLHKLVILLKATVLEYQTMPCSQDLVNDPRNGMMNIIVCILTLSKLLPLRYHCKLITQYLCSIIRPLFQKSYAPKFILKKHNPQSYTKIEFNKGVGNIKMFCEIILSKQIQLSVSDYYDVHLLIKHMSLEKEDIFLKTKRIKSGDSFVERIYLLFQLNHLWNQSQQSQQSLIIILFLGSLSSTIIRNNLFINIVFETFRNICKNKDNKSYRFKQYRDSCEKILRDIFNEEIILNQCKDQNKTFLLLTLGQILNKIQEEAIQQMKNNQSDVVQENEKSAARYYLELTLHAENHCYFIKYAKAYKRINFIKEALFYYEIYYSIFNSTPQLQQNIPQIINLYNRVSDKMYNARVQIANLFKISLTSFSSKQNAFIKAIQSTTQKESAFRKMLLKLNFLSEEEQIKDQYLRCNIFLGLQREEIKKSLSELTVELREKEQRISVMGMITKGEAYWDELLRVGELERLKKQLEMGETPYECIPIEMLKCSIKYHYKKEDFLMVLMLTSKLRERTTIIDHSILELELQALCHQRINYGVEDILLYISEKCTNSCRSSHPSFYFKMLRLLFNKYQFNKEEHNALFLKVFKIQVKKMEHQDDKIQAIFYLLRFLLEKFFIGEDIQINYGSEVVKQYQDSAHWFMPYGNYIVSKIGLNRQRNIMIEVILVFATVSNPKGCFWTIASICCFSMSEQRKDIPQQVFNSISANILSGVESKGRGLKPQLAWVASLVKFSVAGDRAMLKELEESPVPEGIPYVFDPNWDIIAVQSARKTNSGKSCPTEIVFKLKCGSTRSTQKVILKYCKDVSKVSPVSYLMECNTANFFSSIGILDEDVTYKIQQVSRSSCLVQYVGNIGNLQNLIDTYGVGVKECEQAMQRMKRHTARKLLGCFDAFGEEIQANLSNVFLARSSSVEEWWEHRCNFVRTAAQWSYIGYVMGLGDRHVQNILVSDRLKLIHIDFEYNFDHGLKLKVPEWVPFRLTRSIQHAFGILSHNGLFFAEMLHAAQRFQKQEAQIWKALSFVQGYSDQNVTAALLARASFHNKDLASGINTIIRQATDKKYLRQMFDGWKAHL